MDLPKGALSRVQRWAHFLTQVQSYWKWFSEGLYPCPFSQDTAIVTYIVFLTATGHEGTKYIGFFIVPPYSVPLQSGI